MSSSVWPTVAAPRGGVRVGGAFQWETLADERSQLAGRRAARACSVYARSRAGGTSGRTTVTCRAVAASADTGDHCPLASPKLTIRPPGGSSSKAARATEPTYPVEHHVDPAHRSADLLGPLGQQVVDGQLGTQAG